MINSAIFGAGLALLGLLLFFMFSDKDENRRNLGTLLTLGIIGISAFALATNGLKSGIDIAGGTSFTVRIQPNLDENNRPLPITDGAVNAAMNSIENRLDPGGNKGLLLQRQGTDRIIIEMPGATDEEAKELEEKIKKVAKLEMRLVHPQNQLFLQQAKDGIPVPGYELMTYEGIDNDGQPFEQELLIKKRYIINGMHVKDAFINTAKQGVVDISLNGEGGKLMLAATSKQRLGVDRMATVLDGEVLSVATTQGVFGKSFSVSGLDTEKERLDLVEGLKNPLTNELIIDEVRGVSARLGKATVQQGVLSGIVGLGITMVFILIYYRAAGLIALFGLVVNIAVLFGVMAMFGFTFTLPGIAGIILTIGVAVDANVLIYERLREEIAAGKSVGAAIKTAFEKAFSAIFDANITTLIIAIILMTMGSGTIKGFAITLTIGIITSLLTALVVSRVLFYWGYDLKLIKNLNFMQLFSLKNFPFMKMRKTAFPISIALLVVAVGILGFRGEKTLGIDFLGGSVVRFQLGEVAVSAADAEASISDLNLEKQPIIQEETTQAGGKLLSVKSAEADATQIIAELRKDIPDLQGIDASPERVSATLGKQFLVNSLIALGLGLLCIMIYITVRFEFSFAIGAFFALFHDLIIVTGVIGLYSWITGSSEFALIHVGAILTIAGYSINDTIVVFDRIRETLTTKKGDIEDLMNEAINSTLSRTVLTSLTTFFVVLVLYIFGGQALKDFSFAILLGVIVGTYSSIFIASPIVYLWARRKGVESIREDVMQTAFRDEQATVVD